MTIARPTRNLRPIASHAFSRATALRAVLDAAQSFWGGPSCGTPAVHTASNLTYLGGDQLTIGYAFASLCEFWLKSSVVDNGPASPKAFFSECQIATHEWGHIMLGDDYFAQSNPDNPGESPNPNSIMYLYMNDQITPQCIAAMNHPFVFDGRYVFTHATLSSEGHTCEASMYDREGRLWGFEAWECQVVSS